MDFLVNLWVNPQISWISIQICRFIWNLQIYLFSISSFIFQLPWQCSCQWYCTSIYLLAWGSLILLGIICFFSCSGKTELSEFDCQQYLFIKILRFICLFVLIYIFPILCQILEWYRGHHIIDYRIIIFDLMIWPFWCHTWILCT